jgi:hypothetical protein
MDHDGSAADPNQKLCLEDVALGNNFRRYTERDTVEEIKNSQNHNIM